MHGSMAMNSHVKIFCQITCCLNSSKTAYHKVKHEIFKSVIINKLYSSFKFFKIRSGNIDISILNLTCFALCFFPHFCKQGNALFKFVKFLIYQIFIIFNTINSSSPCFICYFCMLFRTHTYFRLRYSAYNRALLLFENLFYGSASIIRA